MSSGLDLHKLRARALLMRWTVMTASATSASNGCRIARVHSVEYEGRTTKLIELAYYATHGSWAVAPNSLAPGCKTPGCVMHLVFDDPDDEDIQTVENRRWARSLGEMFRDGLGRGWFKSGGNGYAG